jgi:hypothetical protein
MEVFNIFHQHFSKVLPAFFRQYFLEVLPTFFGQRVSEVLPTFFLVNIFRKFANIFVVNILQHVATFFLEMLDNIFLYFLGFFQHFQKCYKTFLRMLVPLTYF